VGKGIPRKWVAEVEIEFELNELGSDRRILSKVYRASPRGVTVNGYSGSQKQQSELSQALEEVVKEFVRDLAKLPSAPGNH